MAGLPDTMPPRTWVLLALMLALLLAWAHGLIDDRTKEHRHNPACSVQIEGADGGKAEAAGDVHAANSLGCDREAGGQIRLRGSR